MNMRHDAADSVKANSGSFKDFVSNKMEESRFDMFVDHRQTGFGVPGDVKVYL